MDHARPSEAEKDVLGSILNFFIHQREAYAVWGKFFDPDEPWHEGLQQYENMATPLYYASLAGLQRAVELLLEEGADVNMRAVVMAVLSGAASVGGHREIVQQLLEKGADVNVQGGYYGNAFQAASAGGRKEIIQQLLERVADHAATTRELC